MQHAHMTWVWVAEQTYSAEVCGWTTVTLADADVPGIASTTPKTHIHMMWQLIHRPISDQGPVFPPQIYLMR